MAHENWDDLDHISKIKLLKAHSDHELVEQYRSAESSDDDFLNVLLREREYWHPHLIGEPRRAGMPPSKETVIGAWRDLNRAEALLELIDNSIDAWLRRRKRYPTAVAPELLVYIDLDPDALLLTYEDNAGGVKEDELPNLGGIIKRCG